DLRGHRREVHRARLPRAARRVRARRGGARVGRGVAPVSEPRVPETHWARAVVWAGVVTSALAFLAAPVAPGRLRLVADTEGCRLEGAASAAPACACARTPLALREVLGLPAPLSPLGAGGGAVRGGGWRGAVPGARGRWGGGARAAAPSFRSPPSGGGGPAWAPERSTGSGPASLLRGRIRPVWGSRGSLSRVSSRFAL